MDKIDESHAVVMNEDAVITEDNMILLQNKIAKECEFVPITDELLAKFNLERAAANHSILPQDLGEGKVWCSKNTLFLISKMKAYEHQFNNGMKKNVWPKISEECSFQFKRAVNEKLCENKWKSLKRTYKSIHMANNTSGQKKRHWEYFDAMHEILFNKPEITPEATCSSISGLKKQNNQEHRQSDWQDDVSESGISTDESGLTTSRPGAKKRKLSIDSASQRHKDVLERMDRFNNLFEKMVEKM